MAGNIKVEFIADLFGVDKAWAQRFLKSPRDIGYAVSATLSAAVHTSVSAYPVKGLQGGIGR